MEIPKFTNALISWIDEKYETPAEKAGVRISGVAEFLSQIEAKNRKVMVDFLAHAHNKPHAEVLDEYVEEATANIEDGVDPDTAFEKVYADIIAQGVKNHFFCYQLRQTVKQINEMVDILHRLEDGNPAKHAIPMFEKVIFLITVTLPSSEQPAQD